MIKRKPLFAALLAALVPVPVAAFDSVVNGMSEAIEYETQHANLAQWAFGELMAAMGGYRSQLDPVYPPPKGFQLLDAQIADIIAQGELEKEHLAELIQELDRSDEPPQEGGIVHEYSRIQEDLTVVDIPDSLSFTQNELTIPEVRVMDEDGYILNIDTDGLLPATEIDPRDGGTYESEVEAIQPGLDLIQQIQDQVPAPIQSTGNDLYNQVTGTQKPDEHT